jgi:hypothetical protein
MTDEPTITVEIELTSVQWIGFIRMLEVFLEAEQEEVEKLRANVVDEAQSIEELLEQDQAQVQNTAAYVFAPILQQVVKQASQQLWGKDTPPGRL